MARYEVRPIRMDDQSGRLMRSGAVWNEFIVGLTSLLIGTASFIGLVGLLLLFFQPLYGALAIAVCIGLIFLSTRADMRPRSLIFEFDGRITAPYGRPGAEGATSVGGHHSNIASIEATGSTYSGQSPQNVWADRAVNVALISRGGETVYVGRDLTAEAARNVAVQLTLALQELRQGANGPPPSKDAPDDVID